MKYEVVVPIVGDLFSTEGSVEIEKDGYTYKLIADETGRLSHLAVNVRIPQEKHDAFKSTLTSPDETGIPHFQIGGDKKIYEDLLNKLRNAEAEFAFSTRGALWRINWSTVQINFLPENINEEQEFPIPSFSRGYKRDEMPTYVTKGGFKSVIDLIEENSGLNVLKSFWQEGINYFRSQNLATRQFGVRDRNTAKSRRAEHWSNSFG